MSNPLITEYLELLKGSREYLTEAYPKKSFVLSEKENWEALRRLLSTPKSSTPSPTPKPTAVPPPSPKAYTPPSTPTPTPVQFKLPAQTPPPPPPPMPKAVAEVPEAKRPLEEKIARTLSLTELPASTSIDFSQWKSIFLEKFPHIQLIDPLPNQQSKKVEIAIVYEKASAQELQFLQNIARTCHQLLGPTIILPYAPNQFVSDPPKMVVYYGVNKDEVVRIEPLSSYLQSPRLKAQLWRQLTSQFSRKSS